VATFGVGLLFGFQPPLIALVLERGGASGFETGAITSASTIAVILLGPCYPRAIYALGLRRAVLVGIGLAVGVLVLMPVFHTVPAWFGLRFLTGCALGLTWIASEVWLNRLATDQSRGMIMGMYATVFAAGVTAGPLLLEFTGTRGAYPFVIGALALALTVIPLLFLRRVPVSEHDPQPLGRMLRLACSAPIVMLAAVVAGLIESADVTLLPLLGMRSGLTEHRSLLLVTVFLFGNVVLQLPIGALADRMGRRRTLAACAAISVVGPLLLPATMAIPTLMWALLFLWGGTMYGFYTQGVALLGESFTTRDLAAANTVFVMIYCAGGAVGPSLGGLAMDLWKPTGFVVFVSASALLLLLGLYAESRRGLRSAAST
jgi:MFS family permease